MLKSIYLDWEGLLTIRPGSAPPIPTYSNKSNERFFTVSGGVPAAGEHRVERSLPFGVCIALQQPMRFRVAGGCPDTPWIILNQ